MADRSEGLGGGGGDAPPIVDRTVLPGSDERAGDVWALKERIRRLEALLVQRRPFFDAQYRQSTCYLTVALDTGPRDDDPAGVDTVTGGDGPGIDASTDPITDPGGDSASTGLAGTCTPVDEVVGFALVTPDGYLSLLGVAPAWRRRGIGSRLLARVVDDHPDVSCHVRATNGDAIGFYADHGFVVAGRVGGYYRDGTDAYRLVRDPERADRLADVLG